MALLLPAINEERVWHFTGWHYGAQHTFLPLAGRGERGTGVSEQHRGFINELRWSSHAPKGGNPSLEMRYGESAV